ncbi:MAG: hypothetical protein N2747_01960 [Chitinophagaceae bacterium]|nr:hypothetical protein [Chitinophagaceae bacterium]
MKKFLLLIVTITFLTGCANFGKKVKEEHIEVYYKDGITENEAKATARVLLNLDKQAGNKNNRKSFQLVRKGDTVNLRMVIQKDKMNEIKDDAFLGLALYVSEQAFGNKPVNLELTDNRFRAIKTIPFQTGRDVITDLNISAFGERVQEGNTEVYYKGASKEEAENLAGTLNNYFNPLSMYSFQLLKNQTGDYTVKMVVNPEKMDELNDAFFREICKTITTEALPASALTFELTNEKFDMLKMHKCEGN